MTDGANSAGRRKHKRYEVPIGSFVALGPNDTILGQIIDISMGGLAFRYIDSKMPTDASDLDIFLPERDFCLGKIPMKTISDYEIDNTVACKIVGGVHSSCKAMKRGSVQFGELRHHQESQLEHFIQNYTIGEV